MSSLSSSPLAPNLWIGKGVRIPDGTVIGANVVIHAGTVIGTGVTVQDGAVLGQQATLAPHSSAPQLSDPTLRLGDGAVVCTGAVVFAGAQIAEHVIVGDQSHVREGARVGPHSVIGRGTAIGPMANIGARVRVQTNAWLTAWMVVEDDVFIGPGVASMNDNSMARLAPGTRLDAPVLRRSCRVGGGVLLAPGVTVGVEAFVSAGAVVSRDVPDRAVVRGVPARVVGTVADDQLIEHWR